MLVKIIPGKNKNTRLVVPPSKSIAHRNVICAGLACGNSVIDNIELSKDILATISCMKALGAKIEYQDKKLYISSNGKLTINDKLVIDCNESGSTLRFLIPLIAIGNKEVILKGQGRLLERPLNVYKEIFDKQGLKFSLEDDGLHVCGPIKAGMYEINGNVSSQFITGLLLTLPLLDGDSHIKIIPLLESKSYVDITLDVLKKFNVEIDKIDDLNYRIKGKQKFRAGEYYTEGDYSQMSFFASLGLINNDIELLGLNENSVQGDKVMVDIIKAMNGRVNNFSFLKSELIGTKIDLKDCPDLGPILMALATQCEGQTHFTNAGRLRIKESDRIEAMEKELKKLGCMVSSTYDEIFVEGKTKIIGNVVLNSHNDHRIVMALSILSTIAEEAVMIENAEAIEKSYPKFFEDLRKVGIEVIEL